MEYTFVAGDTSSKLRVTCYDNDSGAVLDLTTRTVKLRWKVNGDVPAGMPKTMTKLNPNTDGKAEYQFLAGELVAGTMKFEVEVVEAGGACVRSTHTFIESVREKLA